MPSRKPMNFPSFQKKPSLIGTVYLLDEVSQPARIGLKPNQSYPNIANRINAIEVKYTVYRKMFI